MGHIRNTAQFVQKRELVLNMCITSQVKLWHCDLDENSKNPGAQQGYTSNGLQIDLNDAIVQILEECQQGPQSRCLKGLKASRCCQPFVGNSAGF